LLLLAALSPANAGLVQVRFDDFTAGSANTEVFNANGFSIDRTVSFGGGGMFGGSVGTLGAGSVLVTYEISGGTFADLFDTYKAGAPASPKGTFNPSAAGLFDGFGFNIGFFTPGSAATMLFIYDDVVIPGPVNLTGAGFYSFRPAAIALNKVELFLSVTSGNVTLNSVDAVAIPEPTSLMLVGTGLIGACFFRRRKV
jgi:hypothetical protein